MLLLLQMILKPPKMNIKPLLFTVSLLSILISCKEQPKNNDTALSEDFYVDDVEAFLDTQIPLWQNEYHVPCVGVALIEDGKPRFIKVYGENTLGQQAPENTIFNVASITKL